MFEAKTKEEVFASLRSEGVKPIKVWPIYPRFHVRKSAVAIGVLAVALGVSLFFQVDERGAASQNVSACSPRHQIYGDPARMEALEADGYRSVLPDAGDRFLAAYAIPGKPISKEGLQPVVKVRRALEDAAAKDLEIAPDDSHEVREIKLILNGMKRELRAYLADGQGTIDSYVMRLRERQAEEMRIYERVKRELESVTDMKIREERNAALRAMGLRTIPRPRKTR